MNERVFLVMGPNCWGKAKTEKEAIKNAKSNFSRYGGKWRYIVYDAEPDVYVDGMGYICYHPKDGVTPYKELRRVGA